MTSFELAPIRRQEPLIRGRLRMVFPEHPFTIDRVPQNLSVGEFRRVVRMTPFLGLAWAGMKPDDSSGRQLKGDMQWRLILINRVSSGLEARFKGDKQDIGMDAMTDVGMAILHGASFQGVGTTTVTQVSSLIAEGYADDDIAISQIDFTFSFVTSPADFSITSQELFEALDITWSVNGSAGPGDINDSIQPPQE
ncbi:hypothetical protein PDO_1885 [Rhizobium sp. PDO1-076]|uniref:hypothetical protein n=1 Tax=Rhizobium sp. PDO1-076 TaxID=1125979 RepID=UPI00024E3445|nr:hypothetical protein [Rhizobium sp. PDO1-076]EHS51494.1 hypothetical protein PDO_1885 [Rhizobium sp. PDO1-076]